MPFPVGALDPEVERKAFAAAESGLLFLFEDEDVHKETQAKLINGGYKTTDMFARYGGSETEIRENLAEDLDLKKSDGLEAKAEISRLLVAWGKARSRSDEAAKSKAEAKASKSLHVIEAGELALMRRAYQKKFGELNDNEVPSQTLLSRQLEKLETNFLEAEPLTETSCLQDKEEELLQSKLGADGQIKIQKVTARIPAPRDGEELRNRHKRLALSWLFAAEKHGSRPWLRGVSLESYAFLSTYILGDRVGNLRATLPSGEQTSPPAWSLILNYEFQVRKHAYNLVMDEGDTLDSALRKSCKDVELRQRYLLDLMTLSSSKVQLMPRAPMTPTQRNAPPPNLSPKKVKKWQKQQDKQGRGPPGASGGAPGGGKIKTDDGNFYLRDPQSKTELCFGYNRGRCVDNCPGRRKHVCLFCLQAHPWPECPSFDANLQMPSTKGGGKGKK